MTSRHYSRAVLLVLVLRLRAATVQGVDLPLDSASASPGTTAAFSTNAADLTVSSTGRALSSGADSALAGSRSTAQVTGNFSNYNDSAFNYTSKISCRSYICNSSSCYDMFVSFAPGPCAAGTSFCELRKLSNVSYSINCSLSCNSTSDRCANQTQTHCTVDCCNTTNCLNATISSMVQTTTVVPATKTSTTATTVTTTATSTPRNGKKCNTLKCSGEKCYQTEAKTLMDCLVGQDFCQLKKIVSGTVMTWEAGCSGNCTGNKPCSSTTVDCTQECCNAYLTGSCLKLDGSLNMPASSTAGLHSSFLLAASWLLAWAISSSCEVW